MACLFGFFGEQVVRTLLTIVRLGGICASGIMKLFANRLAGLAPHGAIVT